MLLVFLIVVTLAVLVFFLQREKRFLKKDLRDVLQKDDVKAYLNRPHSEAHFADDLTKTSASKKPSRELFNKPNPND